MSIVLVEAVSRGFLSNYTTILTTFRELIGRRGYDENSIFISPQMFSLYGNPANWFIESKVGHPHNSEVIPSTQFIDIDPWPTKDQLDLIQYVKYFPYNENTELYLKNNIKNIDNSLGIHYRGTDHKQHVDRVELEKFFVEISKELEKRNYKNIFVATDEENIIEKIQSFFSGIDVIYNDVYRSENDVPIHFKNFDYQKKIELGNQVLLDSHSLSKCDILFCKTSNLINYARILSPNIEVIYMDSNMPFRK